MPGFERMIREAGFENTRVELILGGLVAIHFGMEGLGVARPRRHIWRLLKWGARWRATERCGGSKAIPTRPHRDQAAGAHCAFCAPGNPTPPTTPERSVTSAPPRSSWARHSPPAPTRSEKRQPAICPRCRTTCRWWISPEIRYIEASFEQLIEALADSTRRDRRGVDRRSTALLATEGRRSRSRRCSSGVRGCSPATSHHGVGSGASREPARGHTAGLV